MPEWADFAAMRQGQRLIASAGPLMGLSLLTGSLVGGYVFYKASKVVQRTGRLAMPGDISTTSIRTEYRATCSSSAGSSPLPSSRSSAGGARCWSSRL